MLETYRKYCYSPVGRLLLEADDLALTSIIFDEGSLAGETATASSVLIDTLKQLNEYFDGKRKQFDLPLAPEGTDFQQQVWRLVSGVAFGETKSYGELAHQLGSPDYSRAVGLANGRNPIPIIIPCHRIIGANGQLTGYAGGLERKKWLLLHEQRLSGLSLF